MAVPSSGEITMVGIYSEKNEQETYCYVSRGK